MPHRLHPCNLFAPEKLCREVFKELGPEKAYRGNMLSVIGLGFFFCYTEEFRKEDCRDFLTDGDLFYTSAF